MELNLTAIKKMIIGSEKPLIVLLQKLPLFEGIDVVTIDSLVWECPLVTYESSAIIINEWELSDGKAYVILSWGVDISISWEHISSLSPGAIFGEYALICNENRSATVQANAETQCLVLTESNILRISDETNKLNDILTNRITENSDAGRGVFGV